LLASAAPAGASVVRATSLLPPGESGFVSVTGLANGTGSPHLYDQQQPFIAFDRKDAMLGQPSSERATPIAGVRIIRDGYGVPSVTGVTDYDVWWGAGYATAQDRLFELDAIRYATSGRLAEVLGKNSLPSDIEVRRDFYTPAELSAMFEALPAAMRQRYQAYAAGINAWVDHVKEDPADLPGEFVALGVTPSHFSVQDLIRIVSYLVRISPNQDGSDLVNMAAIQGSGPAKFNRILPLRVPGQVSTIPRADGMFPSVPGRTPGQERRALLRSYAYVRHLPIPPPGNLGTEPVSGSLPRLAPARLNPAATNGARMITAYTPLHPEGSYMVAVRNPRTHHSFLFDGPEVGFQAPEEFYELELHGPGLDVRGVAIPGAPVIVVGHNAHLAFGVTAGLSQTNALYVEHLVPGRPEEYHYGGHVRRMTCRNETFDYRPASSVTLRLCRTVHGPVQARVGNIAYARRYATWMNEPASLTALARLDAANTVAAAGRALAGSTFELNVMAADDRGNIGFWEDGLDPIRPKGWDERLPYPGDGRAEWHGFLPLAERPHVVNPSQNWLANWNTLPSQGWTTGNDPAPERVAGSWFRGAWLARLAAALAKHPSFSGLNRLVHRAGTTAQQRPLATRPLHEALLGSHGKAAVVLRTILDWNGSYTDTGANGTVNPGVAAWQTFKDQLQRLALAPLGPAGQLVGAGEPNSEHVFDVNIGQAYALRTLGPVGWRRAAAATFDALAAEFHSADPARWRAPRAMVDQQKLGAEQPPPLPFFDRGTFEQAAELAP
jgi:acyl-homoserine lactone acylase PvdQ